MEEGLVHNGSSKLATLAFCVRNFPRQNPGPKSATSIREAPNICSPSLIRQAYKINVRAGQLVGWTQTWRCGIKLSCPSTVPTLLVIVTRD
jgi:hypothetical protein